MIKVITKIIHEYWMGLLFLALIIIQQLLPADSDLKDLAYKFSFMISVFWVIQRLINFDNLTQSYRGIYNILFHGNSGEFNIIPTLTMVFHDILFVSYLLMQNSSTRVYLIFAFLIAVNLSYLLLNSLYTVLSKKVGRQKTRSYFFYSEALIIFSLFLMPDSTRYRIGTSFDWLFFFLIFGLQTTIIFILVRRNGADVTKSMGVAALSVLIIGPTLGFWLTYKESSELKKYGRVTKGQVIEQQKTNKSCTARVLYFADEVEYSIKVHDLDCSSRDVGDHITIKYSSRKPYIARAM